ncbi:MAG: hypothetical protein J1F35_07480 [Erysipelotrichales bacterium]|nr:hypothetical protein [Erysipelotrichales bacterium]
MNEEQIVSKYMDEFSKFMANLESKENTILTNSMTNKDFMEDFKQKEKELKDMTFAESSFTDEEDFNNWKQMRLDALNSQDNANAHDYDYNLDKIDEITAEIKKDVERQKTVINHLITMLTSQISLLKIQMDDIYQEMLKTSDKAEKVSLNIKFNETKNALEVSEEALASMKQYRSLLRNIEADYSKGDADKSYNTLGIYADEIENMRKSIQTVENKLIGVDYNDLAVDVIFDSETNKYKISCECGAAYMSPVPEFTQEQITPEALQGVLYKFADRVAAQSNFTFADIREKEIECKINGGLVGKTNFDNAGELLTSNINKDLANVQEQTVPVAEEQIPTEQNQETLVEEQEVVDQNQETPTEEQNTVEQNQVSPTEERNTVNQTAQTPVTNSQNAFVPNTSNDRLKETMKEARRIKSVRKSRAYTNVAAATVVSLAALGLGLAVGAPTIPLGYLAMSYGGAVAIGDWARSAKSFIKYNCFSHKIKKVAKKATKQFNKANPKSGIKFRPKANGDSGEIRYEVIKNGEPVGIIDGKSTGTLTDGLGLSDEQSNNLVGFMNDELTKQFKKINRDDLRKDSYYEMFGVPKITVDNLEACYAEFGGYNFGLEAEQFGMIDVKKVGEGKGIKSLFSRKQLRGSVSTEQDLEELAQRNVNAMMENQTVVNPTEDASISDEELGEVVPETIAPEVQISEEQLPEIQTIEEPEHNIEESLDVTKLEESMNGSNEQEVMVQPESISVPVDVQNTLEELAEELDGTPEVQEIVVEEPEVTETAEQSNAQDSEEITSAWVYDVLTSYPPTSVLEDIERMQYANDIVALDEARKNQVISDIIKFKVQSKDDIDKIINGQTIEENMTMGM